MAKTYRAMKRGQLARRPRLTLRLPARAATSINASVLLMPSMSVAVVMCRLAQGRSASLSVGGKPCRRLGHGALSTDAQGAIRAECGHRGRGCARGRRQPLPGRRAWREELLAAQAAVDQRP